MPTVDAGANQATLDFLRSVRRKLYAVPQAEVDAMSPADQAKYGDSLHEADLAILKLENARLKGVNDAFKTREQDLRTAAAGLEKDAAMLSDAVSVTRAVSEGLVFVSNIVQLLG